MSASLQETGVGSGPIRHLLIIEDTEGQRTIGLDAASYSLGRDQTNSVVLHSSFVSRQHAQLLRLPTQDPHQYSFRIIDGNSQGKRSTNGIVVNGQRCLSHDLRDGDQIVFSSDVTVYYQVRQGLCQQEWEQFNQDTHNDDSGPVTTVVEL